MAESRCQLGRTELLHLATVKLDCCKFDGDVSERKFYLVLHMRQRINRTLQKMLTHILKSTPLSHRPPLDRPANKVL